MLVDCILLADRFQQACQVCVLTLAPAKREAGICCCGCFWPTSAGLSLSLRKQGLFLLLHLIFVFFLSQIETCHFASALIELPRLNTLL